MTIRCCSSRREFIKTLLAIAWISASAGCRQPAGSRSRVFIARADGYEADLPAAILSALRELAVTAETVRNKRILLKPNLVEPHAGADHITTHPLVVRAAAEAFRTLGAAQVVVAEGPGHCRDTQYVLEQSGLAGVLRSERIPFVDLNNDQGYEVPNRGRKTALRSWTFPVTLRRFDWIVSMPKLKTHHWAGVTLSMKNLFGLMPGIYYGWPKNVLHMAGIDEAIFDINMTLRAHLAIVDGITGMEGDGPIMGTPKKAGVLVMGRDLAAVDATSARIMGIDPLKIAHLRQAEGRLGRVRESGIQQAGESIESVRTRFVLLEKIPAHRRIRL